jgi:hypothetical protein
MVPELNLGGTFTMEVWVYLESVQPYAVIMGKPHENRHQDPWMNYVIQINDNDCFEFVQSTGQAGSYKTASALKPAILKQWTHLAATLANGTMRLYINGREEASDSSPGTPISSAVPFSLGAGFSGALRQARVWNYALSSDEIRSRASQPLTGNEKGLIACWPLDEGQGLTSRSLGTISADLSLGDSLGEHAPDWVTLSFLDDIKDPVFGRMDFQLPDSLENPQDVIPFDYDSDGDLDIIITGLKWPPSKTDPDVPVTILNNSGGTAFTVVTDAWVDEIRFTHPRHWTIADFDNDTRSDLAIADHGRDEEPFPGGQSKILMSTAEKTLEDGTEGRLPAVPAFTHNIASGDINGDGHTDLYLCNIFGENPVGPAFYINNGSGIFSRETSRIPWEITDLEKKYTASALADVDNDGDPDLILGGHGGTGPSERFPQDALLINDGNGLFVHSEGSVMPDRSGGPAAGTLGICAEDFNNDGWIDLLMTITNNYQAPVLQLLMNNENGSFHDASHQIPQSWPSASSNDGSWVRWTLPGDFNNDGWLDFLAVGQGLSPTRLYYNTGNAHFLDVTAYANFGLDTLAWAVGDFTSDGRTDILVIRGNGNGSILIHTRDIFRVTGEIQ